MLRTLFFLGFVLSFFFANAQKNLLSPQAEISVLTIGSGASLNDAFGHNAFRIKDSNKNFDRTFDYGRFDFNAPYFYLNFCRGKLDYALGTSNYYDFLSFYIRQKRSVKEQVLDLTQPEKQKLFDYLINNYKPENRNYLYEFFFDNCATKIRDVTQIALNNTIQFNEPGHFQQKKFRTLIHNNVKPNSWGALGIDIALGAVIDRKAKANEHMFLPENIFLFFENATISTTNNKLVKQTNILNKAKNKNTSTFELLTSPLMIFGIIGLLILYITYIDFKKNNQSIWLDVILFSITGIIGIIILLLWFATDHTGTHQNYNLLWASALNILVVKQLFKKSTAMWFVKYLKLLIILLCLLTLHWIIGVQIYAIGLIPFLIALFARYIYLVFYYNKKTTAL